MSKSGIIKKEINKLKLTPIEDKGLVGSPDIYHRSKSPQGYEGVRLAIPHGYTTPKMIPPPIGAAANSLLGRRQTENLPFNYNESYTIMDNGEPKEFLLLVNMHFDNHPKMHTDPSHPPYWHSGVSVFEKIIKDKPKKSKDEEDEEESKEEIEESDQDQEDKFLKKKKKKPSTSDDQEEIEDQDDDIIEMDKKEDLKDLDIEQELSKLNSSRTQKIYNLVLKYSKIINMMKK
jgi:hypothetical protein